MATLLIHTESVPLRVNLPAIAPISAATFYELCRLNPELRLERTATGEVIIMSPTASDTGNRNLTIAAQLWYWAEQDGTGIGFDSSTGFTLPNSAIRSPDAAWIPLARWQTLTPEQQASFAPICPNFVIELRSASDILNQLQAKMQEYIDNGAQLGWLIDRVQRRVLIYRPDRAPDVLEQPETISGEPELPGFILQMAKVW